MIEEALKTLKEGGIVAIPTETSYGLACDPFNEKAVKRLQELKKEPTNKPVLLLVANKQMIEEIVFSTFLYQDPNINIFPYPLNFLIFLIVLVIPLYFYMKERFFK